MIQTYRLWPDPDPVAPATFDLAVTWHRDPAPQGSKSAMPIWRNRHNGPPADVIAISPDGRRELVGIRMAESSKHVGPWRDKVKQAATMRHAGAPPMDGPVVAVMVFTVHRPAAHFGRGRNVEKLTATAPAVPAGLPDVSKLARAVEDALVDARVLADDARIWRYAHLAKVYPGHPKPAAWPHAAYALRQPGVFVHLERTP